MFTYRNTQTGRELERPTRDEWLEASDGWELINEPATAPPADDNERTDD